MKIWLTPSLLDLVLQHCPMWPLRAPVLAKPHETRHGGIVRPALVKIGVSSFTAASSQDSRVMGWGGFIGFQISGVDVYFFRWLRVFHFWSRLLHDERHWIPAFAGMTIFRPTALHTSSQPGSR